MSQALFRFFFLWLLLAGNSGLIFAQSAGGRNKLDFLLLPTQAKNAALGANHLTNSGHDPALFLQNPALLDSGNVNNASINLMPYLSGSKFVNVAYATPMKKTAGNLGVAVQYLNYGTMQETDDIGNVIGEFRAADYSIALGYGHRIGPFALGVSAKLAASTVESYTTWGIVSDWSGIFHHPKHDLSIGFLVKNVGLIRQNYNSLLDPQLPLDMRLGATFKPTYMPIRFTATIHHLNKFDMVYNDPNLFFTYDINGIRSPRKIGTAEKLGRHLSLGAEILLHQNFRILLGYDHLRRQELRLIDRGALAGFSFGAWLKIKKFEIGYGRAQYSPGFGSSSLSIVMNLKNGFTKDPVFSSNKILKQ